MVDIRFNQVSRAYGDTEGLFNFSAEVEKGKAFGLLGPTGAGKTTAVRLLSGLVKPDEGQVEVRGLNPFSQRHELMKDMGIAFSDAYLPGRASAYSFIQMLSRARGDVSRVRTREVLEQLDLNPMGDFHHMMPDRRRKVLLALALLHNPDILILDEPCLGLDANARSAVLGIIRMEKEAGKTIFMCSHVLEELQHCCDSIAIIREGRVVITQTVEALMHTRQKVYHVTFESIAQAAAFAQEWESGVELLRNRVIVAIPASPQVLIKTLGKYHVLDLVGGRDGAEENFLRAYGGDML